MWVVYSIFAALLGIVSLVLALKGKENKYTVTASIIMTMLIVSDFYKSCADAVITNNGGYLNDVVPYSIDMLKTVVIISVLFNVCCLLIKDHMK